MNAKRLVRIGGAIVALSLGGCAAADEPRVPFVRIAELEIDPARLEDDTAAVKEEIETSVRVEPAYLWLGGSEPEIRRVEYDVDKEREAPSRCGLPRAEWVARMPGNGRFQMS